MGHCQGEMERCHGETEEKGEKGIATTVLLDMSIYTSFVTVSYYVMLQRWIEDMFLVSSELTTIKHHILAYDILFSK